MDITDTYFYGMDEAKGDDIIIPKTGVADRS